ncbi:oligopeptide ABC transporter permease OppB [Varunaivibrio sulfuroxidans]|uniref:Oligopeptide transport system permease protein n=1 Tax=Varunaivibrio sulfuroxidans TaxID=1773489 RepID=A0A4R3J5J5_9PROT|nr:oligopeptide ABC transporter permease OppB [Varunaivibrio sulfuroxidans]TCS60595.1 oligopeptide transport system permease protein [Varunaivibrio sulfuroxidans]WES30085.1 oligopeptide ABC transporter permease OppB [Varunaivibrio sulfuroxidans]
MISYIVRRTLSAIPTLFIVITVSFFIMRLAPGGPFDRERNLPPEIEANMLRAYNLDKPLALQYVHYVERLLVFDFGPSYMVRDFTVRDLILDGLPASMQLGGTAIALALVFGVLFGALAALRQNSATDYTVMGVAMTGIAIPNFVMAPILTLVFGVYLSWLPVAGWGGGAWINKVLPIVTLALPQVAYIARLSRGSMIEVLHSNYIRTAHAKGLGGRIVLFRHALKGALLPVVSYLGPATAAIMTGSVVVETIFEVPGIGRYFVQGALNRDYPLVMGVVVFYAALIIVLNLLVDVIYSFLDPKLRAKK